MSRLDGTKEQCNLFYLPGLTRNPKEQKVLFCYILAVLHFDCGGQPVHCFDMMVSRIVFLIALSDLSLLVYRIARDLCINFVSCSLTEFIEL